MVWNGYTNYGRNVQSYPFMTMLSAKEGVFSWFLIDVYTKKVRAYIHVPLIEVSHMNFNNLWKQLMEHYLMAYKPHYMHSLQLGLNI